MNQMRYTPILLALLCAGCSSITASLPSIKPYRMDIQQGNVVTPKMMMQLRPGMSKSQVRFIMGTPLLVDSFHADRWDYFYQMRKDGRIIEQRRVTLEFDGDSLARVRGDVIPAGSDASATPAESGKTAPKSVVKPPKEKDKGLLDSLKFWGGDEKEAPQPAETPQPSETSKSAEPTKPATVEEVKPKMEPATEPKSEAVPEPAAEPPAPEQPLPPLIDESQQAKPAPAPSEPPKQEEVPKPAPKPEPVELPKPAPAKVESVKAPPPAEKPQPVEQPKPAPAKTESVKPPPPAEKPSAPVTKKRPAEDAQPKAAPQPPADLPPEDAPDFFEKMLEKIGF